MVKHGVKTSVFFPATAVLQFVLSLPIFFFFVSSQGVRRGRPGLFRGRHRERGLVHRYEDQHAHHGMTCGNNLGAKNVFDFFQLCCQES